MPSPIYACNHTKYFDKKKKRFIQWKFTLFMVWVSILHFHGALGQEKDNARNPFNRIVYTI